MPLDPQLATLLDLVNAAEKKMHEGTPAEARAAFRTLTVDFLKPEDVVPVGSVEDLTVAGRPARLYRPEGAAETPTLVFFHGGGWVIGDLDTHDGLPPPRRRAGVVVLSSTTGWPRSTRVPGRDRRRLAGGPGPPRRRGGADPARIAVGGDSAGGNLARSPRRRSATTAACSPRSSWPDPAVDKVGDYPSRAANGEGFFLDRPTMEWF